MVESKQEIREKKWIVMIQNYPYYAKGCVSTIQVFKKAKLAAKQVEPFKGTWCKIDHAREV